MTQPFPAGPFESGLVTSYSPWMLPLDAMQEMTNFHIYNSQLVQRKGLWRIGFGAHDPTTLTASGNEIFSFSAANPTEITTNAAHNLSTNDQVVIVGGDESSVLNKRYTITKTGATTFTIPVDGTSFSYTSGAKVFLSPNNRVMGLTTFLNTTNQELMVGWDTKRAFLWDTTVNGFVPLSNSASTPSDYLNCGTSDYIRYEKWDTAAAGNILYFTNGNRQNGGVDGLLQYNPSATPVISQLTPVIRTSTNVYGCKGIAVFKNRLLLFATAEGTSAGGATDFDQRVRWCRINDPSTSGNQWRDDIRGNGGFADAATQDFYISHQQLLNEIVVFFTNSIWVLKYQADPIEPFRWQKVNSYFNTRAPFANVGYDRHSVVVGNRGIYITDGNTSERIDDKIQDFVEESINAQNVKNVYGHRDYQNERAIFLYPTLADDTITRALIIDDRSKSFAEWEIALNVLGDGATPPNTDLTMEAFPESEEDNPWDLPLYGEDAGELTWQSFFFQTEDEALAGGGFNNEIYLLNFTDDDDGEVINSSFTTGEINPFKDQGIEAHLVAVDFFFEKVSTTIVNVEFFAESSIDAHTRKSINLLDNLKEYALIDDIEFLSPSSSGVKVYASSHGLSDGDTVYIYNVKGMFELNNEDWTVANATEDSFEIATDASGFTAYTKGGYLCRYPSTRQLVFKRLHVGATANLHRMRVKASGDNDPLVIHKIVYHFKPVQGRQL